MSDNNVESGGLPTEKELLMGRARLLGLKPSPNIGVPKLKEMIDAKMAETDPNASSEPAEAGPLASDDEIPEEIEVEDGEEQFDEDIPEDDVDGDGGNEQPPERNGFDAAKQLADAKVTAPPVGTIKPIKPVVSRDVNLGTGAGKRGQALKSREGRTPTLRQYMYNEQMKLVRLRIQNLDPKKSDLNGEILTVANKYLGTVKQFVPYGEVTDDGWHLPYVIYKELERRRFLHIRTVKDKNTKQMVTKKSWAKEFALEILPPLSEAEIQRLAIAQAAAGSIDNGNDNIL